MGMEQSSDNLKGHFEMNIFKYFYFRGTQSEQMGILLLRCFIM